MNKKSAFSAFHPAVLFVYLMSILVISMFSTNPVILLLSLTGGILFCASLQSLKLFVSSFSFYIPFFIMVAVTNPLFSHNGVTPLFFMNGNPVTLEALFCGMDIALMIVSVAYWCRCYSEIMTQDKFLYLFSKPTPKLSLVLSMAIRFIPLFKAKAKSISRAQKSMGLYSSDSFVDKFKGAMRVFSALVTNSLENSVDTARSMKARGYGSAKRTSFSLFVFTVRDACMLVAVISFLILIFFCSSSGALQLVFYPEIAEVPCSPMAVGCYIVFVLLSLLPFIIELTEDIKWKYYISKI